MAALAVYSDVVVKAWNKLEMWANAQRDGCPAEYRWRRKVWLMRNTGVPCSNAAKT